MSHTRSEELRSSLPERVSEVAETGMPLLVGIGPHRIYYELLPTAALTTQEIDACVRVTADRARKNWSDLRATTRLLDVTVLITTAGGDEAVFRRSPKYVPRWPEKWQTEHRSKATRASALPKPDRLEALEGAFAELQHALAQLRRRICRIEQKVP